MITFTDVKRTGKTNTFFMPEPIKQRILHHLRNANIPYQSLNWRKIPESMKPEQDKARKQYAAVGYRNLMCIGEIVSDIDPNDMFNKTLLFFGDTMDPDFKEEEENARDAHEMYLYYEKVYQEEKRKDYRC